MAATRSVRTRARVLFIATWMAVLLAPAAVGAEVRQDTPLWDIAWLSDTQAPPCEWITALVRAVAADRPKMVIHTGDARFEWANQCAWQAVIELMRIESPPLEFHLAPGNHDDQAEHVLQKHLSRAATEGVYILDTGEVAPDQGYYHDRKTRAVSGPEWPIWNPEVTRQPNWRVGGAPPYRYVFKRGNIRFIVCDCYYSDGQRDWLRELMVKPDDSQMTILLQHEHTVDRLAQYFAGLEGKHNVKLVLTGHDHNYHQEQRHGVTFITAAGIARERYGDNDAMTLRVYADRLRLDRYVVPQGATPVVRKAETIWECPGAFTGYRRPAWPGEPAATRPGDDGPNRFIILSDLHPYPDAFDQLEKLTGHVMALKPAFVFVLGDIGNEEVPGASEREIEAIRTSFNRMRAGGIEVFPIMGNHDVQPRVESRKVEWLLTQEPLPLNRLFDKSAGTTAYQRFASKGPYDYSFNRGGIHFAVVDSNIVPPKPSWDAERVRAEQPRWEAHHKWMVGDLCRHENNPQRLATIVLLHHPEYVSGDRGMEARPLFRALDGCRERHTVKAVFGGHYHSAQHWPAEANAGADVYAAPASVHVQNRPVEFIVADVQPDQITFEPRDSITGEPRTSPEPVQYRPITGRFGRVRGDEPASTRP